WTTPATVPGAVGYRAELVFTKTGQASLVTDAPGSRTLVTAVGDDGRLGTPRTLSLSSALLTAYGNGAIAVAGTRTPTTAAQARTASVELGTGIPSHGIATVRALPGTAGQQLFALAGNGDNVALVTGTATGHRERIVWVRHGGTLRRALTIHVGSLVRGATPQRGSVWGSQPGARHTRVPYESVSKRAAAGRQIADPVRARRLREDAKRPMSTNLAEGIALSHKLLRFVGVARRG